MKSPKSRSDVGTTAQRFEVTLDGLRELRRRIDQKQLELADWPLLFALVSKQIARAEERRERMIAKIAAAAAASVAEKDSESGVADAASSIADGSGNAGEASDADASKGDSSDANATRRGGEPVSATRGEDDTGESKKLKGHGRNGASAYRNAQHFFHALALGVIGAVCAACGLAKMYRYREKIIIRIVGQPLFSAELYHHEQARCRGCGRIVRADGPACVHEGLGTDYIRYDWSACAMLMVMHYSGGAPFKRLESLHDGWGVPMPDANQWELVDAGDDLLLPLYKALEKHAIQEATNFRIDDTGSRVLTWILTAKDGLTTLDFRPTSTCLAACSREPADPERSAACGGDADGRPLRPRD